MQEAPSLPAIIITDMLNNVNSERVRMGAFLF